MPAKLIREEQIAKGVVEWLKGEGWTVYQEVLSGNHYSSRVADIVAEQNNLQWVIEVKRSLGIEVMEQAYGWVGRANFISVATPNHKPSPFVLKVLKSYGLGCISSGEKRFGSGFIVEEKLNPQLFRRVSNRLETRDEQRDGDFANAGAAGGGHWTPFKNTCRELLDAVRQTPGITPKEAISKIKHHYGHSTTAKASLVARIDQGLVPGVRVDRTEPRKLKLFPV